MGYITTKDGTQIYYKDMGTGPVVSFSHGWPLSADAWDSQLFHLASNGFRVIAHDRRGHGRSGQPWGGNDMDTYADDIEALFTALGVKKAMMVGHSTGGGEVARYIGRHGTHRVSKAAMLSSKLVKGSVLKIYKGGSHALGDTAKEQLNADLLAFAKS